MRDTLSGGSFSVSLAGVVGGIPRVWPVVESVNHGSAFSLTVATRYGTTSDRASQWMIGSVISDQLTHLLIASDSLGEAQSYNEK